MSAWLPVAVISGAALAVAIAMFVVGILGAVGEVRYVHCGDCARWTLSTVDTAGRVTCLRCRFHLHLPAAVLRHLPAHH